jgi:molybdate transport system substrate-binding protein
MELKLRKP